MSLPYIWIGHPSGHIWSYDGHTSRPPPVALYNPATLSALFFYLGSFYFIFLYFLAMKESGVGGSI
jgi:hypothetical protein